MTYGHFRSRTSDDLILSSLTSLSLYSYSVESKMYLPRYKCNTWKEIHTLTVAPQRNTTDCVLVLSVHGEWLLLQWNSTQFFAMASGSLQQAISGFVPTPTEHRFFLKPSFGELLFPIQISPDSPEWFERSTWNYCRTGDENDQVSSTTTTPSNTPSFSGAPVPIVSVRALLVVDDTIFVGISFDGPPASVLEEISKNQNEPLSTTPKLVGSTNRFVIKNGLEDVWNVRQPRVDRESGDSAQATTICEAKTFVFLENKPDEDSTQTDQNSEQDFVIPSVYSIINRVRHVLIQQALQSPKFPKSSSDVDETQTPHVQGEDLVGMGDESPLLEAPTVSRMDTCSAFVLCDTAASVALVQVVFDFSRQRLWIWRSSYVSLSPSSSRLLKVEETQLRRHLRGASLITIGEIDCKTADIHKTVLSSTVVSKEEGENVKSGLSSLNGSENSEIPYHEITISENPSCSELAVFISRVSRQIDANWKQRNPLKITASAAKHPFPASSNTHDDDFVLSHPIAVFACDCVLVIQPSLQVLFFSFEMPLFDVPLFAISRHHNPTNSRSRTASRSHSQFIAEDVIFFGGGRSLFCIQNGILQRIYFPHAWTTMALTTPSFSAHTQDDHPPLLPPSDSTDITENFERPTTNPVALVDFLLVSSRIGNQIVMNLPQNRFLEHALQDEAIPAHVINTCVPQQVEKPMMIVGMQDVLAKGVGVGSTGGLYLSNVGHWVVGQIHSYRFDSLPSFFVSKLNMSSETDQLLLISAKDSRSDRKSDGARQTMLQNDEVGVSSYRTLLYSLSLSSCDPLDPVAFGVASEHKTILFTSIACGLVHVTTTKLVVIPTSRYTRSQTMSPELMSAMDETQSFVLSPMAPTASNSVTWTPPIASSLSVILNSLREARGHNNATFPPHLNAKLLGTRVTSNNTTQTHSRSDISRACASNEMIAVSVGWVVFVFVWRSVMPKRGSDASPSPMGQGTASKMADRPTPIHAITLIQTLTFSSRVCHLSAETIHNKTFLSVGCGGDGMFHLFRLDPTADSLAIEKHIAEKREEYKRMPVTEKVKQIPNGTDPILLHTGREQFAQSCTFIEVRANTERFIRNVQHPSWRMTHFFSIHLRNEPSSSVLSAMNDSILLCDLAQKHRDDIRIASNLDSSDEMGNDTSTGSSCDTPVSDESSLNERRKDPARGQKAAVLMVGVRQGSVSWSIIPLSFLLHTRLDASASLSLTDQPSPSDILVPPPLKLPRVFSYFIGQLPVQIVEDKTRIFVYSDSTAYWRWNETAQAMMTMPVYASNKFHRIVPITLLDEEEREKTKVSESHKIPTHVWIDTTDRILTFGHIEQKYEVVTQKRLFNSCPIKVLFIPQLHAIGVLTREPISFNKLRGKQTQDLLAGLQKTEKTSDKDESVSFVSQTGTIDTTAEKERWQKQQDRLRLMTLHLGKEQEMRRRLPFRDLVLNYILRSEPSIAHFVNFLKQPTAFVKGPLRDALVHRRPSHINSNRKTLREKIANLPFLFSSAPSPHLFLSKASQVSTSMTFTHHVIAHHNLGFHPRTPRCDRNGISFSDLATEYFHRQHCTHPIPFRPTTERPANNDVPLGYSAQTPNVTCRSATSSNWKKPLFVPKTAGPKHPSPQKPGSRPKSINFSDLSQNDSSHSASTSNWESETSPLNSSRLASDTSSLSNPSIVLEDGTEPFSYPDSSLYTFNLYIFDENDVRNLLCHVPLTAMNFSTRELVLDKAVSTEPSADDEIDPTHVVHKHVKTELTLENYNFTDIAIVTIPTPEALVEMRQIEETVRMQMKISRSSSDHGEHHLDPDQLDITPMGSGLTPDEASTKYSRTILVLCGREWKHDLIEQVHQSDLFLLELKRKKISTLAEKYAKLALKSHTRGGEIPRPSFSDPRLFQYTDTAPVHNPTTDELMNIIVWPKGRLRVMGNVQGVFSTRSLLVALNGPQVLLFNLSHTLAHCSTVSMEALLAAQNQSFTTPEMSVELPNSYHCSCCQPFFDEHMQPRSVFPAHYSYVTIHSYSSSWLGLAEWRQNTRTEPSQHQLLAHLIATMEAPACITAFDMNSIFTTNVPFIPTRSLSYSLSQSHRLSNPTKTDQSIHSILSHLIHSSVFLPRFFRMAMVAAPCSLYVCDLTLPHGFPVSLQHPPLFTKYCILYTISSVSHPNSHRSPVTPILDPHRSSLHKTPTPCPQHIPADPLPLQKFSTLNLSESMSTHSTLPEGILRVPTSELLKIGTNFNVTAKHIALGYLPSLTHAVTLIDSITICALVDKTTILMMLHDRPVPLSSSIIMRRHCARCGESFNCEYVNLPSSLRAVATRELTEPQRFIFSVSHATSFEEQNMEEKFYQHFKTLASELDTRWEHAKPEEVTTMEGLDHALRRYGFESSLTQVVHTKESNPISQFNANILRHFHKFQPLSYESFLPHRLRIMPHFSLQTFTDLVPILSLGTEGSSHLLSPLYSDKIPMLDSFMMEYKQLVRRSSFGGVWKCPGGGQQTEYDVEEPVSYRNYAISAIPLRYLKESNSEQDELTTILSYLSSCPRYICIPLVLSCGRVLSGQLMATMMQKPLSKSTTTFSFPTADNISHAVSLIHDLALTRNWFTIDVWWRMKNRFVRLKEQNKGVSSIDIRKKVIREAISIFDRNTVPKLLRFLVYPFNIVTFWPTGMKVKSDSSDDGIGEEILGKDGIWDENHSMGDEMEEVSDDFNDDEGDWPFHPHTLYNPILPYRYLFLYPTIALSHLPESTHVASPRINHHFQHQPQHRSLRRNNTFSYIQSHPHHTHFDDPPIFADNQVHTKRQVILTNTAKFEGDEFYHCSAHLDNGGAISCVGKHTLVLDTCGFMFCSTSGHSKFGGAVYMTVHSPTSPSDGTLNIIRSVFTSCKSDTGGAVYTADLKETHFLNGVCETCEGTSGGALCMELSTVAQSFVNSRFKQCKVSVSGSAISLTCRIPVTITNVSLHEGEVNTPTGSYISGAAIILTQNTIVDQIKFLYLYFADNMAKSSDSRKIPSDILFVHNWREEVRAQFEECYTISAEPCVMHWDGGSHKQINKLLQTPTNSFHVLLSTDPPEDCEDSPYCAIGERPCRTVNYAISRCSKTDLIDRIIYISAGVSSERLIEVVGQTVSLEGAHHNPSSSLETVFSPTLQTAEAKSMFVVTSGTIRFSKIEFWPPVSTSAVTYYACLLTSDTAVGKSSTVTFSDCVISAPATAQLNTLHFPPLFEFTDSDVEFDSVSFFASTENPNQLPVFTENPIFVGVQFRASQFMMSHCRVGQTQVVDGSWLLLTREVKAELSAEFALVAFISNTSFRGISRINSGACVLESRREMGSEETQAEITLSKCSISECELRGYVQHGNLLYFYRSTVLINGTRIEGQGGVGEVDTPQDNSTRIQSHPSNTEITEEMCSKAGVAVWFTHSKARLESSSFVRCPTGAVQLTGRASSLFVSNVSFAANGCPVQHNLVCTGRGNRVEIDSLHSVDGVSLSDPIRANASLWMWTEECWMGGRFVEMESMPSLLFIPSMENVSKATSSEGAMDLIVKGKDLFPCPLKLQLFEIVKEKKTKAEKEQNTTNIDVLSTLDSTAFHIAISANTTNSTNEWRVRREAQADASDCWDCGKCVWSAGCGWGCGGCCGVCGVSAQEGRESAEEVAGVAASAESGREAEAPSEQHSPLVSECSGGCSVHRVCDTGCERNGTGRGFDVSANSDVVQEEEERGKEEKEENWVCEWEY
ncbi:hypothetical protein BLNAU_3002 [Blattamonas nauphoetae]|uniref:Uncharacterized protein n=1 Tax=Blattamonas nauphoetae TaxID=2049346 RepID=A0ABQ9YDU8_9EUKA|nr:hypothetical protein BLNAU_3002 [Blattamonas nauphoetae]